MSRFKGWTCAAVERVSGEKLRQTKTGDYYAQKLCVKSKEDYPGKIAEALRTLGIECEQEYKFLHDRRFRFDIAILAHMIAIEFEGGIWRNGRHTRGKGYANDAKKYNLAVRHGWKLFRFTTEDTKSSCWEYKIAAEIKGFVTKEL
jgi:hypothetical protein